MMKKGSGDDPLADKPNDDSGQAGGSLPYYHNRNHVKQKRTQDALFLRDGIKDSLEDLVEDLEPEYAETVYLTDVKESAILYALDNSDGVAEKLEEMGYGWQNEIE